MGCVEILVTGLKYVFAAIAGLWVVLKYYQDKAEDRRQKELQHRRQAYLDLFTAIPLLQRELGKIYGAAKEVPGLCPEWFAAYHRLHLFAESEAAVKCVISRNAIHHKGSMELTVLKKTALELEGAYKKAGEGNVPAAVVAELDRDRAVAWNALWARSRTLLAELSANYRDLIRLARAEVDLDGGIHAVVAALRDDQELALRAFDEISVPFLREGLGLPASAGPQ